MSDQNKYVIGSVFTDNQSGGSNTVNNTINFHYGKPQLQLTEGVLREIATQLDKDVPVEITVAGKDYADERGLVRTGINTINSFLLSEGFSISEINICGIVVGMQKAIEVRANSVLVNFDN